VPWLTGIRRQIKEEMEMRTLLLSFAVCIAGFATADDARPDKIRLQGHWIVISCEQHGRPDPKSVGDFVVIEAGKGRFVDKDDPCDECEFVVAIFPDEDPKQIDFKYTGTEHREDIGPGEDTIHGIYEFRGDCLLICLGSGGDPRPKQFKTKPDDETTLMLLRRQR
jgi:uncharacterized protein (TIGR03067 family)